MHIKINRQGTRDEKGNRFCDPNCRMSLTPSNHNVCRGTRGSHVGKTRPLARSKTIWKRLKKHGDTTLSLNAYRRAAHLI